MTHLYSDLENLVDVLKKNVLEYDEGTVRVVRSDCVIDGLTTEELRERNISDRKEEICTVRWDYTRDKELDLPSPPIYIDLKISFHEDEMTHTFQFQSSGGGYSRLHTLSKSLGDVQEILDDELGCSQPDFLEMDSASVSGGFNDSFADREFTYLTSVEKSRLN